MAVLLQAPYNQFLDDDGNPLTEGTVYSYEAGTDTPKATYTSYTGLIPASNPVELDAAGRADIWIQGSYKFTVKDADGVTIRTVDNIEAVDNSGDMTKAVYDPANIAQQLVGTTAVQTVTNKTLTAPIFSAGTTGAASNVMTAGTNLTTPVAGSTEYDGKVQYFTPIGTQRGLVPSAQTLILNSDAAGSNVNTAQSVFTVGCTLSASTYYEFEGTYYFSKAAGATNHSFSTLFGGTATFNRISYSVEVNNNVSALSSPSAVTGLVISTASATAVVAGIASAASYVIVRIKGNASVNAGGTFIPQYQLGAAPGGAYNTVAGSSFRIWPSGASGASINIGPWVP